MELEANPDILAEVAARPDAPFCVGFAAESRDLAKYAEGKRVAKKLKLVVGNLVQDGLGGDNNTVTLFDVHGAHPLPPADKHRGGARHRCAYRRPAGEMTWQAIDLKILDARLKDDALRAAICHPGSAGIDSAGLHRNGDKIHPGETILVPTGPAPGIAAFIFRPRILGLAAMILPREIFVSGISATSMAGSCWATCRRIDRLGSRDTRAARDFSYPCFDLELRGRQRSFSALFVPP
jgi:hypothetical protein